MSNAQLRTLESYIELMNTSASLHAFRTALELGIFTELSAGQKTSIQLAEKLKLKNEPTAMLLDALCPLGVLEKYEDDYALSQLMRVLPNEFLDLGNRHWQHLAEFIREGTPIPDMESNVQTQRDYEIDTEAAIWTMTGAALEMIRVLDIGKSRRDLNILELACGSAVWSIAMAHNDEHAQLTLVDEEERLERANSNVSGVGIQDRVTTLEGDYATVKLPANSYDIALIANNTHLNKLADVEETTKRVFQWLKPGGEIVIIDVFSDQDEGARQRAMFSLELALRTNRGRVHSPTDLQDAIMKAGFNKPQYAPLPSPPYTLGLMVAAKPHELTIGE